MLPRRGALTGRRGESVLSRRLGAPRVSELDGGILASTALLAGLGTVMIYSTTAPLTMASPLPPHFLRHLVGLGLAALLLLAGLQIPLASWRRVALPIWAISVLLLVATLLFGIEANGARRWLALPGLGVSLQASELARFATPLAVASLLADAKPGNTRVFCLCLTLTGIPVLLLLLQPDLGSAALLAVLVGALLFVAGVPLRRLGALAGMGVAFIAVYMALRPYASVLVVAASADYVPAMLHALRA